MKSLTLIFVAVILIFNGCVPDIEEILENIDSENSGHMYIYTAPSVQSELAHMNRIREVADVRKSDALGRLLRFHIERTGEVIGTFRKGSEVMIAIKKPPRPCPPPAACFEDIKYISYFTVNPEDRLQITVNGKPVRVKHIGYNELTHIRTVKIPGKLKYNTGDTINVKLDVSYIDSTRNTKREVLDWRIQTSGK